MATILYMLAGLASLGYYLNQNPRIKDKRIKKDLIKENEKPTGDDIYNSRHLEKIWRDEYNKSKSVWRKSEDPINTNIIGPVYKNRPDPNYSGPHISANKIVPREHQENTSTQTITKRKLPPIDELTSYGTSSMNARRRALAPLDNQKGGWGNVVKDNGRLNKIVQVFPKGTHNNMEPFFGGTIKQNIDPYANKTLLEDFTGTNPIFNHKREIKPMFALEKNNYIHGLPVEVEKQLDRYEPSIRKTNILPFQQIKVKPGLDGKQQQGFQDYYRPSFKTVEQLRVNPKETYKGRVIGKGTYVSKRTKEVPVVSRAPNVTFTNDPNNKDNKYYREMLKNTFGGGSRGKVNAKDTIILESTERELYGGKLADLPGTVKGDNKDYIIPDIRISAKPSYSYDNSNLHGFNKNVAYNLEDYTKPTIRQQTENNRHDMINLNSTVRGREIDPTDGAKTTLKEQFVSNENESINVGGVNTKHITYDDETWKPEATIREQFENNQHESINVGGAYKKLTSYDEDDLTRTTIRQQTIDHIHSHINAQDADREGTVNPYDHARMTIKEQTGGLTTLSHARGNNNEFQITTGVQDNAKITIKQQTMSEDYVGQGMSASEQMGRQDMYNAEINALKELTVNNRNPTKEGVKVAPTKKQYNVETNKISFNTYENNRRINKAYEPTLGIKSEITSQKQLYDNKMLENRIDPKILSAFNSNPYSQPLTSYQY